MTQGALESCARGTMWTDYDPTPMTEEWYQENNYISKKLSGIIGSGALLRLPGCLRANICRSGI